MGRPADPGAPSGRRLPTSGDLRVRAPGGDRFILGRVGRTLVATEARHSVLVLGPTQSGKTTGLAIPALLEWDGPVVATSVKGDLVAHTRGFRAGSGPDLGVRPDGHRRRRSDVPVVAPRRSHGPGPVRNGSPSGWWRPARAGPV